MTELPYKPANGRKISGLLFFMATGKITGQLFSVYGSAPQSALQELCYNKCNFHSIKVYLAPAPVSRL